MISAATSPDIQKLAWTRSHGRRRRRKRSRMNSANSPMYGSSASFGNGAGGPAGTCTMRTPFIHVTVSGSWSLSRRVYTSTS